MIQVLMPQMGESLAEGTVVRWLKTVGDPVARDEPLVEISTDKVDTEVPAPAPGVLKQILVREGETVAVGTPVALVEPAGDAAQDASQAAQRGIGAAQGAKDVAQGFSTAGASAEAEASAEAVSPASPAAPAAGHFRQAQAPQLVSLRRADQPGRRDRLAGSGFGRTGRTGSGEPANTARARVFSPAVLEAARQGGLPLDRLTMMRGSGRGGRITKRDVEEFLRRGAAPSSPVDPSQAPPEFLYRPQPEDRRVPMSPVRRTIARHMIWSARISPHATAFAEADMSRGAALLAAARDAGARTAPLTYTALFARAAVRALGDFPALNASVVGDEIVLKPRVHLGVAVALPGTEELIVPVIRAADELTLGGIAAAVHDLSTRAREARLQPADVQGGTFTVTNPGVFGGLGGTPILNQPQVAILGTGAVVKRAVVVNDAIAIRPIVMISLTFDHRAADGMVAFRYLARVRELLEAIPVEPGDAAGW